MNPRATQRPTYTWLQEFLAASSREQIQDWIAAITYVPVASVPLAICDADFAYHWYRYIARLADEMRKRPDEETARMQFAMFADEADSVSRCEILKRAHRDDHLKLFPNCPPSQRVIVQHTSRETRAGKTCCDGINAVTLTVYRRANAVHPHFTNQPSHNPTPEEAKA